MDRAQKELKCCGNDSYTDWFNTEWANTTPLCGENTMIVPGSCCKPNDQSNSNSSATPIGYNDVCFCDETDIENIYHQGCFDALFGKNGETLYYLLGTAFGCALIQLICMIIAICIFYKQRQIRATRRY